MKEEINKISYFLIGFSLWLALVGLIFSPFLLSVGMFGIGLTALFRWDGRGLRWADQLGGRLKSFFSNPAYLALMLVILPILWSGLYSANSHEWLGRLRIKSPFFGLTIVFFLLPQLSQRDWKRLAVAFIAMIVLSAIGVLINYGLHFKEINDALGRGHSIPVPRNHIRYSLNVAIALMLAIALAFDKRPVIPRQRPVMWGVSLFLLIFLHVLAVRSGWAAMYIGLFVYLIYGLTQKQYIRYALGGLAVLALVAGTAWMKFPSLRKKIGYAVYDWTMQKKPDKKANYSDYGRRHSILTGIQIGNEHRLTGIGAGDVRDEMSRRLSVEGFQKTLLPHNEFAYFYAAAGLPGLLLFLIGILTPIVYRKRYKHPVFLAIQLILLSSFFVEATLETSIGTGLYLLWTLMAIKYSEAA